MDELFKIKRKITFDIEKRLKDDEKIIKNVPIRLVITYNGIRINLFSGFRVDVSKWNIENRRVETGYTDKQGLTASKINSKLSKIEVSMDEYFQRFELVEKRIPSPEEIKEYYRNETGKKQSVKKEITFFDIYDQFTNQVGKENAWTAKTFYKYATLKNHLLDFDSKLTFESLTNEKLMKFINFLIEKKELKNSDDPESELIFKGLRNSSVSKSLLIFKSFLKWATSKKFNTNTDFIEFKPKLKGSSEKDRPRNVIYLNWDELQHLLNLDIEKNYLSHVRDVFCFCCFTGLRYSDVYNLKNSDIKNNAIELVTIKTADKLTIELNKYSSMILAKYKDFHFKDDKALPVISNQKMNDYLHELGELAGFTNTETIVYFRGSERIEERYPKYQLLGTHSGRKTFVCNALALGIPAEVVMKFTGHSTHEAMRPYIAIAEELKKIEMSKFNK